MVMIVKEPKIADRLKELREIKGITQQELADTIGVSRVTIGTYEKGTATPQTETLIKISKNYNVSMDWLCALSENEKNNDLETYADLFQQIIHISTAMSKEVLMPDTFDTEPATKFKISTPVEGIEASYYIQITITDETLHDTMNDYLTMKNLHKKGTISDKIFNDWLDGKKKELSEKELLGTEDDLLF